MSFDSNDKSNNPSLAAGFLVTFCFIANVISNFTIPLFATYVSTLVKNNMLIKCIKLSSIFLDICGFVILPHKVSYHLNLFLNVFLVFSNYRFSIHGMHTKHS